MSVTLAEEIVLIAYRDDGVPRGTGTLDYAVGGAVLLELALAGRVEVRDKRVAVLDPAPVGDDVVDAALARIAGDEKSRKPKDWVYKLGQQARPGVLDSLVRAGVLERRKRRFLLVPYTRYPAPGGVEPPVETAVRDRVRAAVLSAGPVEPRTAAMCALIGALGWRRQVFGDLPKDQVKARLTELRKSSWAAGAVHKAIEELNAAVVVTAVT